MPAWAIALVSALLAGLGWVAGMLVTALVDDAQTAAAARQDLLTRTTRNEGLILAHNERLVIVEGRVNETAQSLQRAMLDSTSHAHDAETGRPVFPETWRPR